MQNISGGKTALNLDNNMGALVCYLNICLPFGIIYSIIVLATDKTNKLPRFHAVQSLLLSLAGIPLAILYVVGSGIGYAIYVVVGISLTPVIWLLVTLLALAVLVGGIIAAVKAFQGQIFKLPIIGGLADKYSN